MEDTDTISIPRGKGSSECSLHIRQQRRHKGERSSLDPLIMKLLINNLSVPDHLLFPLTSPVWSQTLHSCYTDSFPHSPVQQPETYSSGNGGT